MNEVALLFSEGNEKMRSSFVLLGMSSIVVLVSALGGIGAISALEAKQDMVVAMQAELPIELPATAEDLEEGQHSVILYGSLAMLFWCIVGAIIGAWTYVFIIPDQKATPRRMAAKLVSAAGCGVTLTPLVIHVAGLPRDPNLIGGISTFVALGSVGLIVDLFPLVLAKLRAWILGKIPCEDEGKKNDKPS
jgi:hypothetical protein